MKAINDFVGQFRASIPLDESRIVRNRNRYYLLSKKLKQQVPKGFFYAGSYLGAVKGASLFPSFLLLAMIAESKANKLVVDKRRLGFSFVEETYSKRGYSREMAQEKVTMRWF